MERTMLLDEHVPEWDTRERHSIRVAATPEDTLAAVRAVTSREVPLMLLLMGLRTLPAALLRRSRRRADAPILAGFERMGFVPLRGSEVELVYGLVGRFWQPSGGIRPVGAADFAGFAEPGYAKAGFNFMVAPNGDGGCILSTETRVVATDAGARRRFRLYWTFVHPGSALIRRDWLRAIRSRAERAR
jgi:hypothetical protein